MDDARSPNPRRFLRTFSILGVSLLIGGGLGFAVAAFLAPPSLARFEARAGDRIERDHDAGAARARLEAGAARDAESSEPMALARRAVRIELGAAIPPGPIPTLGPSGECASRLRGLASVLRSLSAASPDARASNRSEPPAEAQAGLDAIRSAVAARDPRALGAAVDAWLEQSRNALLARAAALDPRDRFLLWSEWRADAETRATEFEFLATEAEAAEPAANRPFLAAHAALRGLAIEASVPDPSAALRRHPAAPARITVRPLPVFWGGSVLGGALLGLVAALPAFFAGGRRHVRVPDPLTASAHPGDASTWLHVVAAADRERLGRAVGELVAHPLARRERVVVVDASRRGRLHEMLRLSPQLGLVECATRGLPALGLLQSGGFTGLFLLSRGSRRRLTDWLVLDRVIEELRPHFARVVLAFDADVPAMVGGVLAGRMMRGWWAGPGAARSGRASGARSGLAAALAELDLVHVPEATLAAVEARLVALSGVVSLTPQALPEIPSPAPIAFKVSPPAVLEGDLKIRQRLRYLAWMKRMHREREAPAERT